MADVLVIEDQPVLRDAIRRMLVRAGHTVRVAADGGAALALYRERAADLVVTDLLMPDTDGIDTIRELRSLDPDARILAMSGRLSADPETLLKAARQIGADAALAKPFGMAGLLQAVAGLTSQS